MCEMKQRLQFKYKNSKNNLPCKCKARGHKMAAGDTERTSGYFRDQTPSE
jgi:hypothetical protein